LGKENNTNDIYPKYDLQLSRILIVNSNTMLPAALKNGTNGTTVPTKKTATPNVPLSPIKCLLRSLEALERESFQDDGERIEALHAAYALVSRLETPWETILRLCMGQVCYASHSGRFGSLLDLGTSSLTY
jgi:hypothetical protein